MNDGDVMRKPLRMQRIASCRRKNEFFVVDVESG